MAKIVKTDICKNKKKTNVKIKETKNPSVISEPDCVIYKVIQEDTNFYFLVIPKTRNEKKLFLVKKSKLSKIVFEVLAKKKEH